MTFVLLRDISGFCSAALGYGFRKKILVFYYTRYQGVLPLPQCHLTCKIADIVLGVVVC